MNLLFISNDPSILNPVSGARLRMREYAKVLEKEGGSLYILSSAGKTSTILEGALHLYGVKVSKFRRIPVLARLARRIIQEEKIEVASAQDPFEHGLIGLLAIRGTDAKLHIQIHTDFLSPWFIRGGFFRSSRVVMPVLNRVRIALAGYVLPRAHGIRVVSERIKDSLSKKYGKTIQEVSVIPVYVKDEIPSAVELPPHAFSFALIAVSRLESEKRIEDILIALKRLNTAYPSLGLILVGEGSERKRLVRLTQSLGLENNVLFLGQRNDAVGLMQSAQAFIQASAYEGYGMTLIEAALAECPIITTDVGIVGEVFTGYEHVLSAPVGDPTNLAAHIAWLIEDPSARKELAMNAKSRALEHLASVKNSPEDIISDIKKIVA